MDREEMTTDRRVANRLLAKTNPSPTPCFRGQYYGVFAGPNGYYVAAMAADGISHYQPANGGSGWTSALKRRLNDEAADAETLAKGAK